MLLCYKYVILFLMVSSSGIVCMEDETQNIKHMQEQIQNAEDIYLDALYRLSKGKMSIDQFVENSRISLTHLYEIMSTSKPMLHYLKERAFDIIIRVITKIKNENNFTQQMEEQFLQIVRDFIIPENLLSRNRDKLSLELLKSIDYYLAPSINQPTKALHYLELLKIFNAQAPIKTSHLKQAYDYQVQIAERYLDGSDVTRDLEKAEELFLQAINSNSPTKPEYIKKSLQGIFEIIHEKLDKGPPEQDLDEIHETLENILLGTYQSTLDYKEKAAMYHIDLALSYASPAIEKKDKARKILDDIINSPEVTGKTRRLARETLKKL
ncbi:MAG: hypothetical protein K2X90_00790 [Candidatus Babeliaceae bacterium]|nr:hypothetical protein [Candidatus Babeliaceae bacterium]